MTVLKLEAHEVNPRNSEGSFVTLKDGKIMFVYSKFNGETWHDNGQADLVARYSSDGGESWSYGDELIVKNTCASNVMSVSLLRLQSGKIALLYLKKEDSFDCRPVICFSNDEGKSWSEPAYCINKRGYFVVNNDRLIQLKNGRLFIPAAHHRNHHIEKLAENADIVFYYSDDEGITWQESKGIMPPPDDNPEVVMQEPGVIELNDGTLWAWTRTEMGSQYVSYSKDNGDSWSPAKPSDFTAPCSPMSVKRNPQTGDLIAVWNDINPRWNLPEATEKSWGRTPLVIAKSYDDSKSWKDFKIIESDPTRGYCYIAIHFVDKGILLSYCCGGGETSIVLQDTHIKLIES